MDAVETLTQNAIRRIGRPRREIGVCVVAGCNASQVCRYICRKHYNYFRKKDPLSMPPKELEHLDRRVIKTWRNVRDRCNQPKVNKFQYYGGRGVKCLITREELQILWDRDCAYRMKHPSIDRKDGDGDYTFENCQFIEFDDNRRKRGIKKSSKVEKREKANG